MGWKIPHTWMGFSFKEGAGNSGSHKQNVMFVCGGKKHRRQQQRQRPRKAVFVHACMYASALYSRELGTGGRLGSCLPELVQDEPTE